LEIGLDYFGARYYGSALGRFVTPDCSAKAEPEPYAKLDNPQTLNLYSYVLNKPLSKADPDGHCADHHDNGSCKVNVNPATGKAGVNVSKQLEGVLNKYDKDVNVLADKAKFDIKDSKGNVIGSLTGKEIKAVWNGTSFTVTDRDFGRIRERFGTATITPEFETLSVAPGLLSYAASTPCGDSWDCASFNAARKQSPPCVFH
jgi:RHS repeat-associated protein